MPFRTKPDPDVEVLNSKRLIDSFLKIDQLTIRHRKYDGDMSPALDRMVISKPNSIGVLLHHVDRDSVLLVEQFRYPAWEGANGWLVEIVAGNMDADEDPVDTVRREVLEETGYRIQSCRPIGQGFSSPGISTEKVYLYFAEVDDSMLVDPGGGIEEEGEDIRIVEWKVTSLVEKLRSNSISDLKTQCALQWFVMNKGFVNSKPKT